MANIFDNISLEIRLKSFFFTFPTYLVESRLISLSVNLAIMCIRIWEVSSENEPSIMSLLNTIENLSRFLE